MRIIRPDDKEGRIAIRTREDDGRYSDGVLFIQTEAGLRSRRTLPREQAYHPLIALAETMRDLDD